MKEKNIALIQLAAAFTVVTAIIVLLWGATTLLYIYLGAWVLAGVLWFCSLVVERLLSTPGSKPTNPFEK